MSERHTEKTTKCFHFSRKRRHFLHNRFLIHNFRKCLNTVRGWSPRFASFAFLLRWLLLHMLFVGKSFLRSPLLFFSSSLPPFLVPFVVAEIEKSEEGGMTGGVPIRTFFCLEFFHLKIYAFFVAQKTEGPAWQGPPNLYCTSGKIQKTQMFLMTKKQLFWNYKKTVVRRKETCGNHLPIKIYSSKNWIFKLFLPGGDTV